MSIVSVRGFNDILPEEAEIWRYMEEESFRVFSGYGFSEIKAPIVERTELFSRSIGETTDIVEKEMYTFLDRNGDSLTLRPEGTAPVVRAYIEHKLYASPLAKFYYTGPMFRYERPQKGRYRQFYQIGAEVLGDSSPGTDAESIEMLMRFFERIGLKEIKLEINSLGCPDCRPVYKEKLYSFLLGGKVMLCDNCVRRIETNPLRALDCKNPGCIEATREAPSIIDSLCAVCSEHFAKVRSLLKRLNIDFTINPRMVRGLDYYTKTTFEITSTGLGSQNAVAAGGRYDGLVGELGGPMTPCFGFAIGMERVALLIRENGVFRKKPLSVFIALGAEAEEKGVELLRAWRERGLKIIEDFSGGTLKSRMKRADKLGAGFVLILGSDELKAGEVTIKDMSTAGQERLSWEFVPDRIEAR